MLSQILYSILAIVFSLFNWHNGLAQNTCDQTGVSILKINTGYDYAQGSAMLVNSGATVATDKDFRWYKQEVNTGIGLPYIRSNVYAIPKEFTGTQHLPTPYSNSNWISDRNTKGIGFEKPIGNTEYLFDFCLGPGYQNAQCTLRVQVSQGDSYNVYFHDDQNPLMPTTVGGNEYILPLRFRVNRNTIKVVVNNTLSSTGDALNVQGEVTTTHKSIVDYCKCLREGEMTGTVFEDLDNNGIQNGLDYGIEKQNIKVYKFVPNLNPNLPGVFEELDDNYGNPLVLTTDRDGNFSFFPPAQNNYKFTYEVDNSVYERKATTSGEVIKASLPTSTVYGINFGVSRLYVAAKIRNLREKVYQGTCGSFDTEFLIVDNAGNTVASSVSKLYESSTGYNQYKRIFDNISYRITYNYDMANGPLYNTRMGFQGTNNYRTPYNVFNEAVLFNNAAITGTGVVSTAIESDLNHPYYGEYHFVPKSSLNFDMPLPAYQPIQFASATYPNDKVEFLSFEGDFIRSSEFVRLPAPNWSQTKYFRSSKNEFYQDDVNILHNQRIEDQVECCPLVYDLACTTFYRGEENFTFTLNGNPACSPNGTNCQIDGVLWEFKDLQGNLMHSSTDLNPDYNFTGTANSYKVDLTVYVHSGYNNVQGAVAPCTLHINETIILEPPSGSSIVPTSTDCAEPEMSFSFLPGGSFTQGNLTYFWDFGDNMGTSSAANPTYTYQNAGNYNVTLIVQGDNCSTIRLTKSIDVNKISVDASVPAETCKDEPFTTSYFYTNSNAQSSPPTQTWNFNDGSILNPAISATHAYSSAAQHQVTLTAIFPSEQCTIPVTKIIEVKDNFNKAIQIQGLIAVCLGVNSQFNLTGDYSNATSFQWNFGNGKTSTMEKPMVSFEQEGSYTVSVTVNYGAACIEPSTATLQVTVKDFAYCKSCEECIGSFAPEAGKTYVVSAWVKQANEFDKTSYENPGVSFYFEGVNQSSSIFKARGMIVDGWQKIEESFTIPENTTAIQIELVNTNAVEGDDVFFDDIRIYPFDANLKSFVYDPITMRLTAELDENNFATYYEYDEEGNLVRIKKETERGVKTIQETVKRTKQNGY